MYGPGGQPFGQPYGQPYGRPYEQPPPGGGPVLGGSWHRLVARVIDSLIVGVVGSVIAIPITGDWADGDVSAARQFGAGVLLYVLYFLYEGFQLDRWGRTLGKRFMHLKVVRVDDGGPLLPSQAWSRAGVYCLPGVVPCFGTLFWLVNVLWHIWDVPWHQCLHDKVARSTVIRVAPAGR